MLVKDNYTIECLKPYLSVELQVQITAPCEIDADQLVKRAKLASSETAEAIANCLKIGVEHSADSDPDIAFSLAETIIAIGQTCNNGSIVGLGTMAHGDILTHSGRNLEAWDKLEEAGSIYLRAADQIGWARTRINRLSISAELGIQYVDQAFEDAAKAEGIFLDSNRYDRLMRLYHAWAFACSLMRRYEQALIYYQKAIGAVEKQTGGHNTDLLIARLHGDIGNVYNALGELRVAMDYLHRSEQVFLNAGHRSSAAIAQYAIAINQVTRGQYRQALHLLLNGVLPHIGDHRADRAKLTLIECYIALNRNQEAYRLAQELVSVSKKDPNRMHQTALSALMLATIQTRLGLLAEARESLDLAETNFYAYESMVALIQLRRGQVALWQGDFETARSIADETANLFRLWQQPINWIDATLLGAEARLFADELESAKRLSLNALRDARESNLQPSCYRAYVMLAQVLEKQGVRYRSIQAYQAALTVLRNIQRSLTLSLRVGFLEDKLLPFRRLMHLYLTGGQIDKAFRTLEQLKAEVFWDFLAHREQLIWPSNAQTRPLLEQLMLLRDKHRWLTRMQYAPPATEQETNPWYREVGSYTSLLHAIVACEKEIQQLVEQLYLYGEPGLHDSTNIPHLKDVQDKLDSSTIVIEYYVDREQAWCIGITHDLTVCHPISVTTAELHQLIEVKWRSNLEFALQIGPGDPRAKGLADKVHTIGERLYQFLLQPLHAHLSSKTRVIIVPFGALHQLPFNILRSADRYLIETHEIVILPSAGLLLRTPVCRENGAVVAAHSWDGRLSISVAEGRAVQELMGGSIYIEEEATRDILNQPPRQVLHISTHGEHRIDQPDFSYIELGDGAVYTDDLLQCDLSYELVVLSACEVGRSNITAGEEMIGLGRGFLYAGAGALITSLWRVTEEHTFRLMQSLYKALCRGDSKARALQTAQRDLFAQNPDLHPAFWAAFQLICNPDPLSAASPSDAL